MRMLLTDDAEVRVSGEVTGESDLLGTAAQVEALSECGLVEGGVVAKEYRCTVRNVRRRVIGGPGDIHSRSRLPDSGGVGDEDGRVPNIASGMLDGCGRGDGRGGERENGRGKGREGLHYCDEWARKPWM